MLSWIVGNVDVPAAAVLVAFIGCVAIVSTAVITKYKSAAAEDHEFELNKMRIESETQRALYAAETDRTHKIKMIEQNLITSHRAS